MMRLAYLAMGCPMALATKGTVLDALGFASMMYTYVPMRGSKGHPRCSLVCFNNVMLCTKAGFDSDHDINQAEQWGPVVPQRLAQGLSWCVQFSYGVMADSCYVMSKSTFEPQILPENIQVSMCATYFDQGKSEFSNTIYPQTPSQVWVG